MPSDSSISKQALVVGWILTAVPALMLAFSAVMKLLKPPEVVEGFTHLGWDPNVAVTLGIVELVCAVLYLIPRTSVLGAILVAAYLGGATATHVRLGEPFYVPVLLGVVAWGGLYLRDRRVRDLIPLRS